MNHFKTAGGFRNHICLVCKCESPCKLQISYPSLLLSQWAQQGLSVTITLISFFKVLLCFLSLIGPQSSSYRVGGTQFQACIIQQNKPLQTKQWPGAHLNIYVILKTTDCGVISVSELWGWKTLNNYESYRQVLSVHEWATLRHEWAFVSLWWAVKQAWKYKWTLPWG